MSGALCPICRAQLSATAAAVTRTLPMICPRCGPYQITEEALSVVHNGIGQKNFRRSITSHAIRRQSSGGNFTIDTKWLLAIWEQKTLPRPQEQADILVQYLGGDDIAPGTWVPCPPLLLGGVIGTGDDPASQETGGFKYIADGLQKRGYIERNPSDANRETGAYRLTYTGWERLDELLCRSVESRTAFMAMGYGNENVDQAVSAFSAAVSQTGYELRRLDEKPKAGLIDLRMRVEIRAAKFLIADLTAENRGAYWEAGFAEGLSKKVYYTCEAEKFEKMKTHFDTEHLQTVKWTLSNMESALDELKSAIRNDFPMEANLIDA